MQQLSRHLLLGLLTLVLGCAEGGQKIDAGGGDDDSGAPHADARPGSDGQQQAEICDGEDNDGDQFIDEDPPEEMCGTVDHGTPVCNGLLGCQVGSCDDGWYDINQEFDDGCECTQEDSENNDNLCTAALDLGDFPDNNSSIELVGNLIPASDEDYYRFRAVDSADTSCDTFHVRVLFLDNPNNAYAFDVWRGGCGVETVCSGGTDMQWYTNFTSPEAGQCPCSSLDGTNHHCTDDTALFHVRVYRRAEAPVTCDDYRIEISNGKYPAP